MAFSMMTNRQKQKVQGNRPSWIWLTVSAGPRPLSAFNVFQQRGNRRHGLARHPHQKFAPPDELNLPAVINRICEEQRGLVLVTGTTGSG